jgi:hypothetical protein
MEKTIEYNRQPNESEIKRGYGATHYLTVDEKDARKKDGTLKKWLKNPYNELDRQRYYY